MLENLELRENNLLIFVTFLSNKMTDITSVEIYLRTFYQLEKYLTNIDSRFARGFFSKKRSKIIFFEDSHLAQGYKRSRVTHEFDYETFFFITSVNQDVFSRKLNIFGFKPQMVNFAFCFDLRILEKSVPR